MLYICKSKYYYQFVRLRRTNSKCLCMIIDVKFLKFKFFGNLLFIEEVKMQV